MPPRPSLRTWGLRVLAGAALLAAIPSSGCYALALLFEDAPDAGPGPDAGTPTPGLPDAGPPDAGLSDAGLPDAGLPDAGLDAGLPDAGPRDAGFDAGPDEWHDLGLTQRVRVLVDATGIPGGVLVDFPIPFSIPGEHPAHAGPSGLRVFDDEGTGLPLALASFSPPVVHYWTPLSVTAGSEQGFWLYFGGAPQTPAPEGPAFPDHVAVYHLDFASPPTFNYFDSAGVLADPIAVPTGFDGDEGTDGVTGRALAFDGVDDRLVATTEDELDTGPGEVRTWSAWVRTTGKPQAPPNEDQFEPMTIIQKEGDCSGHRLDMIGGSFPQSRAVMSARDPVNAFPCAALINPVGGDPTDGAWHLLTAVFDRRNAPASVEIYLDADFLAGTSSTIEADELVESDAALIIGANFNQSGGFFLGEIDEIRVRAAAPRTGWLPLRLAVERDGAVTLGDIETR